MPIRGSIGVNALLRVDMKTGNFKIGSHAVKLRDPKRTLEAVGNLP